MKSFSPHEVWSGLAVCLSLACWAPPLGAQSAPKPTHENVKYGPHERNVLDFWQARADTPSPLVVFIHGGGFRAGDKGRARPDGIRRCLDNGVSYAAINYRYRTDVPIQDVLRDCGRAVQFLRSRAKDWHIDPARVASHGGSAGAGTSLWLAFHDDLADPKSDDPVRRESSRICAAGATGCQASYDLVRWKELFDEKDVEKYSQPNEWAAFYGLKTREDLFSEQGRKIRADVDMLGLIRKGGSPVWLASSREDGAVQDRGHLLHHPRHAQAIKKRCDEVGVEAVLFRGGNAGADGDLFAFLFKHLGVRPGEKK